MSKNEILFIAIVAWWPTTTATATSTPTIAARAARSSTRCYRHATTNKTPDMDNVGVVAVALHHHHTVVICHVYVCDEAIARELSTDDANEVAIGAEQLHTSVLCIANEHIAVVVNTHTADEVQLARLTTLVTEQCGDVAVECITYEHGVCL